MSFSGSLSVVKLPAYGCATTPQHLITGATVIILSLICLDCYNVSIDIVFLLRALFAFIGSLRSCSFSVYLFTFLEDAVGMFKSWNGKWFFHIFTLPVCTPQVVICTVLQHERQATTTVWLALFAAGRRGFHLRLSFAYSLLHWIRRKRSARKRYASRNSTLKCNSPTDLPHRAPKHKPTAHSQASQDSQWFNETTLSLSLLSSLSPFLSCYSSVLAESSEDRSTSRIRSLNLLQRLLLRSR